MSETEDKCSRGRHHASIDMSPDRSPKEVRHEEASASNNAGNQDEMTRGSKSKRV